MSTFDHGDEAMEQAPTEEQETPVRPRHRKKLQWIAASMAFVFAATSAGVTAASMHHPYKLDLDGSVLASYSWNGTVRSALADNDVNVGQHDVVSPNLDTPLVDGMVIHVKKAKLRQITVEGETKEIWSTANSADQLLREQAQLNRDVTLTASRSSMRSNIPLVTTDSQVPFVVAGQTKMVSVPAGHTLTKALEAAQIQLGADDTVRLNHNDGGLQVVVNRVEFKERTVSAEIPFPEEVKKTAEITQGKRQVKRVGVKGRKETLMRDKLVNNEVVSSEEISSKVVAEPVSQIVLQGTGKPKPKPAPSQPQNQPNPKPRANAGGDVWAALARCESGGNPRSVSRSGKYHGLYQFSVSTWRSVGGSGLPSQASPAEQLKRAKMLQARSGWGQWPACSRKIGVR